MDVLQVVMYVYLLKGILISETACEKQENKRFLLDGEPGIDIGAEIGQLRAQLMKQQQLITTLQSDLEAQKNVTNQQISEGRGSAYVRWGRNVCPATASLVYKGFVAGKHYIHPGSGTDNLCLPADPTWSHYTDGSSSFPKSYIYGTELNVDDNELMFNYPVNQQDIPCAVCWSNYSFSLMIPGRNNCYSNWHMEYNGYLMGADHTQNAFEHVCVDTDPEFLPRGGTNDDQHILYLVEAQCGSLPCPPYVAGRELACVVCSK